MKPDGSAVDIKVFIRSPHDEQVRNNTRFYNAGGLDMAFDSAGLRINTESMVTLMIGGLAFETPTNLEQGDTAAVDADEETKAWLEEATRAI